MAEKNTVPNLEAKATDGIPVFTPRQWLERFRQFCKREHKMDITPLVKGENMTDSGWSAKEQAIQEDFLWGVRPEALYQITRAEYKTEPDSIKVKDLIRLFAEFYMPKKIHTIIVETSSGRNKQKRKHRKTSGDDHSKSKKNVTLTLFQQKNC